MCVGTRRAEEVAAGRKTASRCGPLVAVERVINNALAQVPDLDSRISGRRDQVSSVGVKVYLINGVVGTIIVLNWLVTADVKNFDDLISSTTGDAGAIRMKFDRAYSIIMVVESNDRALRIYVPQLTGCVLGAGRDESSVWREHGRIDPVSVGTYREHEASVVQLEDLYVLVIRAREQQSSIVGKRDRPDWGRMTLDHLGEAFNAVRPNTNSLIARTRDDGVSIGRHAYTVDCSFVPHEAEGPHHWLEVPNHDSAIE